jgi:hypothetical protein
MPSRQLPSETLLFTCSLIDEKKDEKKTDLVRLRSVTLLRECCTSPTVVLLIYDFPENSNSSWPRAIATERCFQRGFPSADKNYVNTSKWRCAKRAEEELDRTNMRVREERTGRKPKMLRSDAIAADGDLIGDTVMNFL